MFNIFAHSMSDFCFWTPLNVHNSAFINLTSTKVLQTTMSQNVSPTQFLNTMCQIFETNYFLTAHLLGRVSMSPWNGVIICKTAQCHKLVTKYKKMLYEHGMPYYTPTWIHLGMQAVVMSSHHHNFHKNYGCGCICLPDQLFNPPRTLPPPMRCLEG